MYIAVGVAIFVVWLLVTTAFHLAGGLIYLLPVLAAISLVLHFVNGRSAV